MDITFSEFLYVSHCLLPLIHSNPSGGKFLCPMFFSLELYGHCSTVFLH